MRIVPKLSLALVAGTCAILTVNGVFRVRREVAFFESDRVSDHEAIGRSLGVAVSAMWKSDGRVKAIETIDAFHQTKKKIDVRWHDAPAPVPDFANSGEPITRIVQNNDGRVWQTWVPIDVDGKREGAIEMIERASGEDRFAHATEVDTIASAAAIALLSALLAFGLGQWFIGRPVHALADKARRVGGGDFASPVVLTQHDELFDLATEMNAMSENLSTTLTQLRHADRLATVGKLASGVAHELGTPLNVVHARASMVAAEDASVDETKESARVIIRATDRMTKIIRQLLQFARTKSVTKAPCDLFDLCRETVELLNALAQRRNVKLVVTKQSNNTTSNVDAGQIQQVVTNLVMNAVQAMPNGGEVRVIVKDEIATTPIDFGKAEKKPCTTIAVVDSGSGISTEDLPRIFEPFFTTKDVGEGTGLGLAVSYGIVRDHGGWIHVDTDVARGTTFRVYLPKVS